MPRPSTCTEIELGGELGAMDVALDDARRLTVALAIARNGGDTSEAALDRAREYVARIQRALGGGR